MGGGPTPTAVACDLGGVLIPAPFDAFAALELRVGAAAGTVRAVNARNPDDNAWARLERREITVEGFVDLFTAEAHHLGHRLPAREVIDLVTSMSPAREFADEAMVEALETCRDRGLRLALITNNVRPLRENPDSGWLFELFDTVIESCVVATRKPEPEIYELALGRLGTPAEETVMLDDLGINLKAARALGLQTLKVVDPKDAARQLLDLLPTPAARGQERGFERAARRPDLEGVEAGAPENVSIVAHGASLGFGVDRGAVCASEPSTR